MLKGPMDTTFNFLSTAYLKEEKQTAGYTKLGPYTSAAAVDCSRMPVVNRDTIIIPGAPSGIGAKHS